MPDCHAFCADLEQAKKEFITRFNLCIQVLDGIGLSKDNYEAAIRFTKDFYEENKEFISYLAQIFGKPVLVEMWKEPFFYFRLKWDFNFVDNQDKAAALSTDQIDVENAKRYGITYTDEKGEKHHPLILHCSPSGAIERCVYALLEKAYKEQQSGKPPMLPLWLSPTQARIIPMSDKYFEHCEKLAEAIEAQQIRVDIDDRPFTLQKRVREAEMEWVPYIIVVGQKETQSDILPVRCRKSGGVRKMKLEELISEIKENTKSRPFKSLPLPRYISRRPQFYGK
jgi:threonyl-tRNA synthetase